MSQTIEEAAVRVLPDFDKFGSSLRRGLRTATTGVTASVKIEADGSPAGIRSLKTSINRAVREASKEANTSIKIVAKLDDAHLRSQLERIARETLTIKVKYDIDNPPPIPRPRPGGGGGGRSGGDSNVDFGDFFNPRGLANIGKAIARSIAAAGPEASAAAVGVGAVVVAALSAEILTGVATIGTAIGAGGALTAGIVLALKDPAIKAEASSIAGFIGQTLQQAAAPIGPALLAALSTVANAISALKPQITSAFANLAPSLTNLGAGASGLISQLGPALQSLSSAGRQVLDAIAVNLPRLAPAINSFAASIEKAGPGMTQFISDVIGFTGKAITFLGKLLEYGSEIYNTLANIRDALHVLDIAGKVFNGLITLTEDWAKGLDVVLDKLTKIRDNIPVIGPLLRDAFSGDFNVQGLGQGLASVVNGISGAVTAGAKSGFGENPVITTLKSFLDKPEVQRLADQIIGDVTSKFSQYSSAAKTAAQATQNYNNTVEDTADSAKAAYDAIGSAQNSLIDAQKRYKDSLDNIKAAQDRVKDSTNALADAREQARRQLRDAADAEESASIRLAQAQEQEMLTRGLSPDNLQRRQAVLDLKNAQEDQSDLQKDNAKLRAGGIENNPNVLQAKDALKSAEKGLSDAYEASDQALKGVYDAQKNVTAAQNAYHKELRRGKQARDAAYQNMIDSKTAADNLHASLKKVDGTFTAEIKADGDDATAKLKTVQTYIRATELQVEHPDWSAQKLWDEAQAQQAATNTTNRTSTAISVSPSNRAMGGPVYGRGTDTSDDVPALLSKNEHIITAAEVAGAGGHAAIALQRMKWRKAATGGPADPMDDKYWSGTFDLGKMNLADTLLQHLPTAVATDGGPDSGTYHLGAVKSWVRAAANLIGPMFGIKTIGGKASSGHASNSDHYWGGALDFMTNNLGKPARSNPVGTRLANYVLQNIDPLSAHYVIWNKRIWNEDRAREGWRPYHGASDHTDHVHVSFDKTQTGDLAGVGGSGALPAGIKVGGLKDYFLGQGASGGHVQGSTNVARVAEATARAAGATNKMLLALMEAGLVESGMRNLNFGDRDSLGFLQQRPSQGWPDPTNVATATRSFIHKAKLVDKKGYSSGRLAQAVQVSAYPGRYQLRHNDAYAILNREAPGIPAGIYDTGGILKPNHAAINTSDSDELVLNGRQVANLGGMSTAEKREFATMIAQALQASPTNVLMEGKVVAKKSGETIAEYFNLP